MQDVDQDKFEKLKSMEKLAMQDPLTGLINRRSFNAIAKIHIKEAQKSGRTDIIAMIDIDHFRKLTINTTTMWGISPSRRWRTLSGRISALPILCAVGGRRVYGLSN